jgi:Type IX secretion system membrane protein PorP/SprF
MQTILKFSLRIKPVIWIVILLIDQSYCCYAQLDNTVFEDFTQTSINPYLINPSATDTSYYFKIRVNTIDELGLSKNVNRFYLDVDKRIYSDRKHSFHFIGLQTLNSKIGQYISRNRLQARYSWNLQLSPQSFLSAGISLGFINYAFLTTQGGTGGSDFGPDGAFGIHFIRQNTKIGLSIQQLFSPVLIPVDQSFKLVKLYNLDISQRFRISPRLHLSLFGVLQYANQNDVDYSLGLMSDVAEYGVIGVNNFSFKKTSFNFGIQHIRMFGTELSIISTYSIYNSAFPTPNSTFELFMALEL